uniref:Putative lipocalin n=1 Tax=Amblyomma cajennense TaxID=34607 RepID=A0A023FQM8_AMBCJ
MDLWPWYLLYLITVVMLTCHGKAKKVQGKGRRNGGKDAVSPWEFLSSTNIYLNKTNITLPVKCIKARTVESSEREETLSHVVSVKFTSGSWYEINATYAPVNKTRRKPATAFISVDPGSNVTTIYTFLHTNKYCAVVNKWKRPAEEGLGDICELWVNDEYLQRPGRKVQPSCSKKFKQHCKAGFSYDKHECDC